MPTGGSFTPVGVALNTPVITTSPDANLTNEQALSPLGTGILKVATGTLSLAAGADLPSHNHAAGDITSGTFSVGLIPSLPASQITSGQLDMARGGTGVDLSTSGGAGFVLKQDASHVITAAAIAASDLTSALASPPAIGGTTADAVTGTIGTFGTSVKTPIIFPAADSTSAVKVTKADGATSVITVDTTNSRLGIGVTPTVPLEVQAGSTQGGAFSTGTSTSPRFIGFAVTGSGTCDLLFNTYLNNVNALVASKLGAGGTLEFSTGGTLTYYASASVAADTNRTFATVFHIDSTGKFGIGNGQSPLSILHPITTDTASGAVTDGITLERTSSGTPSAGYGTNFRFLLKSSTTARRLAATIKALWNVETDASRAPDLVITASDANAEREIMRGRATGSAPAIAFLGATPAVQQTGGAATATIVWTATEQSMLQKAYDALRTFGFLS